MALNHYNVYEIEGEIMGRAAEVRKKARAETAAAKTKVYSKFGKELYLAAKAGVPDPEMNVTLKRTIEKAKKAQVPSDVIKRAIDKAKSGTGENYSSTTYEGFGPGASTLIVECLTDNPNRCITEVRTCFTKAKSKLGISGCVSHNYDHVALLEVSGISEDEVLEACMNADVDITDISSEDGAVTIIATPDKLYGVKEAIEKFRPGLNFTVEEVTYLPTNNEYVSLAGEEMELFEHLLSLLDEVDDVQEVYHNVKD